MGLEIGTVLRTGLKRRVILMFAVELIFLALLGGLLITMQTSLSVDDQKGNTKIKLEQVGEIVEQEEGKADSLSFMFRNDVLSGYTAANMQEAKRLLEVDNVAVVDKEGNIVAKAEDTRADFTLSRYNQLRESIRTGNASDGFDVSIDGETSRYYASAIDDSTMAVLEQNTEELEHLLDRTSTWKSMLSHVTVGLDGYAFAISAKDYTFLYHPEEELVGTDALSAGIPAEELEDGNYGWLDVDGRRLYCGVKMAGDAYVVCAVSEEEITASRNSTVAIILFVVFTVFTLVITYGLLLRQKEDEEDDKPVFGKFHYSRPIGSKIGAVSVLGLVCILLVSFYMQTLFSLSRQSMSNSQRVQEIEKEIKKLQDEKEEMTELYDARYLNKARIAAYITEKKPELSDKLLLGMEYLIQEAQPDDVSGKYYQYIGVARYDAQGYANGLTQIGVTPEKLEDLLSDMKIEAILSGFKVGKGGIVFAIDKEGHKSSLWMIM